MIKYNTLFSIDPGPSDSAYVILSLKTNNSFTILDKDHINNDKIMDTILKTSVMYSKFYIVIETIVSYGNLIGQSTIDTAIWAGQFYRFGKCLNLDTNFLSRPEVQLNLCNNKRAKPKNMKQAIKDRFGDFGTKKNPGRLYNLKGTGKSKIDHIWSAFELAITFIDLNIGTAI